LLLGFLDRYTWLRNLRRPMNYYSRRGH
jgi:hypothetical protein